MNIRRKISGLSLLVILILSLCLLGMNTALAQTSQADSKLQQANDAVNLAFSAVLDAEKAGANVTTLLVQLNGAAGILAQAENSYRTGDSNTALTQANNVLPITVEVITSAQQAKQTATVNSQNALWSTIALAVIGAFALVLTLFLSWRWFKRRYINSLSEAKPEVTLQ